MLDQAALKSGLERLRSQLEKDILERSEDEPSISEDLHRRYAAAKAAKRTGLAFELWRENEITQAAVAWLLGCVFVRFLEDNELIEQPWISGPGERLAHAKDHNLATYRAGLHQTDRDYLLLCFEEIAHLPCVAGLFDKEHNPLYRLSPTGHGARAIIDFFQRTGEDGNLLLDFSGTIDNTRFLGDLYQNISESARKRYALVQTPDFVVDFILDRAMTPALEEFGLEGFRIIDPACGSGHFLLAAFERLFHRWQRHAPDLGPVEHANRALGSVYGVDVNPFAIAIARFRLLIAALRACEVKRLRENFDFSANLAVGDSLLHGTRPGTSGIQRDAFDDTLNFFYETEDKEKLRDYLRHESYHAIVGNPPYITAKDSALRDAYRARFRSCSGAYQLGVPFTERIFELAIQGDRAGTIGMITSNAFMKRTSGRKFVKEFVPKWDFSHVIDSWVADPDGHDTPTVILLARNRMPQGGDVRVVRGNRRAPSGCSDELSGGPAWQAILGQIDVSGSESAFVSVADVSRESLNKHPWPMGGRGAAELKEYLERICQDKLRDHISQVGRTTHTGEDDVFFMPQSTAKTHDVVNFCVSLIDGKCVRHYSISADNVALFPYSKETGEVLSRLPPKLMWLMWPWRSQLRHRADYGRTIIERGLKWFEHSMFFRERYANGLSIAFPFISTHNQFVFDSGAKLFNRTAPVLQLTKPASEVTHVEILGLLNSSVAGFWFRQICFPKDGSNEWFERFEYDGGKVSQFPLAAGRNTELATAIQHLANERTALLPTNLLARELPTRTSLDQAQTKAASLLRRMIALQEELDWHVYFLYGLTKESITLPIDQIPEIELGQRAFEIVMGRQMAEGELETEWFNRHGSTPITQIPSHCPEPYHRLVQGRLDVIASDHDIALIEQPEYKRRWNLPKWEALETEALRKCLLDRLEDPRYWPTEPPLLRTVSNLSAAAAEDAEWMQVAELYTNRSDFKPEWLVAELVEKESIPFLPVLRYKPDGLVKRKLWEQTWDLQRREDAGEQLDIPVAPKYDKKDFLTDTGWRLRGKLDVPKERWVSYPHLESNADSGLLIGWAGYDHAQQALALASYYQAAREEGWSIERLKPILAGIQELLPWVQQWHNQPDTSGVGTGDFIAEFLREQLSHWNVTPDDLRAWMPSRRETARITGRARIIAAAEAAPKNSTTD